MQEGHGRIEEVHWMEFPYMYLKVHDWYRMADPRAHVWLFLKCSIHPFLIVVGDGVWWMNHCLIWNPKGAHNASVYDIPIGVFEFAKPPRRPQ